MAVIVFVEWVWWRKAEDERRPRGEGRTFGMAVERRGVSCASSSEESKSKVSGAVMVRAGH